MSIYSVCVCVCVCPFDRYATVQSNMTTLACTSNANVMMKINVTATAVETVIIDNVSNKHPFSNTNRIDASK